MKLRKCSQPESVCLKKTKRENLSYGEDLQQCLVTAGLTDKICPDVETEYGPGEEDKILSDEGTRGQTPDFDGEKLDRSKRKEGERRVEDGKKKTWKVL